MPDVVGNGTIATKSQEQQNKAIDNLLASDYVPDDILLAFKETVSPGDPKATSRSKKFAKPDAVWFHRDRRKKYQHLVENPPCTCGAGRDVSFLYDVTDLSAREKSLPPIVNDKSQIRKEAIDAAKPQQKQIPLPDSIIPSEFHIVKSKGVLGLEINDDNYTARTEDHSKHLTVFPSLKPASRQEIAHLKLLMNDMISAISSEDDGATQMHSLLSLVKKEQEIYNIIFHEIIRQTTVECVERGQILSDLRQKYAALLDRIPRHVRSMHAEVMAQRALDRRLTEELHKFKDSIKDLTKELGTVKEHDRQVTEQASRAKNELRSALIECDKNASLINEYHQLYELQRQRLENQVSVLTEEKDVWCDAAYSLAVKVADNNRLNTLKRLHISEKSWTKLASHFTLFLSDRDAELLGKLQEEVDKFQDIVMEYHHTLIMSDKKTLKNVTDLRDQMDSKLKFFEDKIIGNGRIKDISKSSITEMHEVLRDWHENLSEMVERYSGDSYLTLQETLASLIALKSNWTEAALQLYSRHPQEDGSNYADIDLMHQTNELVATFLSQCNILLNGDNGVAKGMISVNNDSEFWELKFHSMVNGSHQLSDNEWNRFLSVLKRWVPTLSGVIPLMGSVKKHDSTERVERLEMQTVLKAIQHWISATRNGIDNEDQRLIEVAQTSHKSIIYWMIQVLLVMAPDRPDNVDDSYAKSFVSADQVAVNGDKLFTKLERISKYIVACATGAVTDPSRSALHDTDADYRHLKNITVEANTWINTAKLLVQEMRGEKPVAISEIGAREETGTSLLTETSMERSLASRMQIYKREVSLKPNWLQPTSRSDTAPPVAEVRDEAPSEKVEAEQPDAQSESSGPTINAICQDGNVRQFDLENEQKKQTDASTALLIEKAGVGSLDEGSKAFESVSAMELLQKQLVDCEQRSLKMEERALNAEKQLKDSIEELRLLKLENEAREKEAERKKIEAEEQKEAASVKKD